MKHRLAFLPWCAAIEQILGAPLPNADGSDLDGLTCHDLERMFAAELTPVEAAAAIAVDEFSRSLQ